MSIKVGLKVIDKWNESIYDSAHGYDGEPLNKGQIVFYGASNFTRWSESYGMTPLREVIRGKSGAECAVNRGFGSSCAEHQLYYYPHMVRPLEPKVLVYQTYGNARAFGYTTEETWELEQRVITYAITDFPDITLYICGGKPSLKTSDATLVEMKKHNEWVKEFCKKTPNCHYVDYFQYEPLILRKDIFVEDGIHFNQEGYDIYADFFRMVLKDELDKF